MKSYDIIIIGGGASGLAAAIEAKRSNKTKRIAVLEQLQRVGKKILATGNGRCNLGNLNAQNHPYKNREFAEKILSSYNTESLVEFFKSAGLYVRSDNEGRLYPHSNTAASVLDALRFECENLGIKLICDCKVNSIKKEKIFVINGEFTSEKVIVACGGKAAPSQGSDGSGYALLKAFGHKITPLAPGLVQLVTDTAKTKALKGVRAAASLSLSTAGSARGEILFTDYGISGIAAMDLSRFILPGSAAEIAIDFVPDFNFEQLKKAAVNISRHSPALPPENLLSGLVPKALSGVIIKSALGYLPKSVAEIGEKQAQKIAEEIKNFTLELKGTKSFNDAQITLGGADVSQFNCTTLESKKIRGLYACGEILDVDGACGGYNLAWAFASGRTAGHSAAL